MTYAIQNAQVSELISKLGVATSTLSMASRHHARGDVTGTASARKHAQRMMDEAFDFNDTIDANELAIEESVECFNELESAWNRFYDMQYKVQKEVMDQYCTA